MGTKRTRRPAGDLFIVDNNVCRTGPGRQTWTFVWGPGGFHTPEDFGTLRFD